MTQELQGVPFTIEFPNACVKMTQRRTCRVPTGGWEYIFVEWVCTSFECAFNPDFPGRCPFAGREIERGIDGVERLCHCEEARGDNR
jgi:hypothetical protein